MRTEFDDYVHGGEGNRPSLLLVKPDIQGVESSEPPVMPMMPPLIETGRDEEYFEKVVPLLEQWADTWSGDLEALWVAPSIPKNVETQAQKDYDEQLAAYHISKHEQKQEWARSRNFPPPLFPPTEGIVIDFQSHPSDPAIGHDDLEYFVADE